MASSFSIYTCRICGILSVKIHSFLVLYISEIYPVVIGDEFDNLVSWIDNLVSWIVGLISLTLLPGII